MKCKCGYLAVQEAVFCMNCGERLQLASNRSYANIDSSIKYSNVINGNGSEIHVTNNNVWEKEMVHYRKIKSGYSFSLASGVKAGFLLLFLSIAINFASISRYFGLYIIYLEVPYLISFLLWMLSLVSLLHLLTMWGLKVTREAKVPLLKGSFLSLDIDERNKVSVSNHIISECPFCPNGYIVVQRFKEENQVLYAGQCNKNGQHLYTFDDETYTGTRIYF